MTYLITGVTGDVGSRVVDSLLAFGERPRVLVRDETKGRSSTGNGKRAFIYSDDIAAVATKTLMTGAHVGASLPLTGPEALSFSEVALKLGAATGSPLRYQPISDEEARRRYANTGAPPAETEAHVCLWRAIREGRLGTVTNWVERVFGRKPSTLDRWAAENALAFRSQNPGSFQTTRRCEWNSGAL